MNANGMTEKEILQRAKAAIQARDFYAARAILRSIPQNKTAIAWLAKLDTIAPEIEPFPDIPMQLPQMPKNGKLKAIGIATAVGGVIALMIGANALTKQTTWDGSYETFDMGEYANVATHGVLGCLGGIILIVISLTLTAYILWTERKARLGR